MIIASPHCLCVGYKATPTFLRARSAGDAALDERDSVLRAESDRGSALMSITVPGRSRSSSLVPLVKGRFSRHRLLRAPGMSHLVASRPSLKLLGMLDEPTARCLHLVMQLRQPVVQYLGGKQKHPLSADHRPRSSLWRKCIAIQEQLGLRQTAGRARPETGAPNA